jgi:peptidoglycan hydrolase-like protein with peptidoglycan-binding domain
MQFFKNFQTFNESLDIAETNKKLGDVEAEIKKDEVNFNKVLRKLLKVTTKSDILSEYEVKKKISKIFDDLNVKLEKSSKKESISKDPRYVNLKSFVAAFENDENENAQKIAAEGKKLVEEEKKKEETEKTAEGESTVKDKETHIDVEKYKKLIEGTKISTKSAPQLSVSLAKQSVQEVKVLQQFLMDKGYLQTSEASAVDGFFGEKTKAAVIQYQKEKGLTQDGVVGKNTWSAILNEIGMTPENEFKAFQLSSNPNQKVEAGSSKTADQKKTGEQAPAPAKEENRPVTATGEPDVSAEVKEKYKELTGLEFGQKAPAMTVEKIVKDLTNQRMSSVTVPTDEEEVAKILINQINNGVLNQNTMTDFLTRYKNASKENSNGLVKDIMDAFDTDFTDINSTLAEMEPEKANNSIIFDAIVGIGTAARWFLGEKFSDDTGLAITVFLAFISTKNEAVISELRAANINVVMAQKILNYKANA